MSLDEMRRAWTRRQWLGAAVAAGLGPLGVQAANTVKGAGASFPAKVYQRWAQQFAQAQGVAVQYQATGSGDGVRQAVARSVDFGGTDAPLKPEELERQRLVQIPMLVGGVVPVLNLPELEGRSLRLTGESLAELMQGRISRWDDPVIAAHNPGLRLPARRVERVVRADKSGTSEGFSRYLAGQSAAFRDEVGEGQTPRWPGEPLRAEGNDGVSAKLRSTPGGLGYVSFDRVQSDRLSAVHLRNRDGQWQAPSEAGFRAAILHSELHRARQDTASLLDRPGHESWPITLTSFVLLDAQPAEAARIAPAMRFLYWCFMRGDELTRGTGFAPLPAHVQAHLVARFAAVQPRSGGVPAYQSF